MLQEEADSHIVNVYGEGHVAGNWGRPLGAAESCALLRVSKKTDPQSYSHKIIPANNREGARDQVLPQSNLQMRTQPDSTLIAALRDPEQRTHARHIQTPEPWEPSTYI